MSARAVILVAVLSLALALPVVLAQDPTSTDPSLQDPAKTREEILKREGKDITFYGHQFGFGRGGPMPMNTQFPTGEADYSIGTSSLCGHAPPAPNDAPYPPAVDVPGFGEVSYSDCRAGYAGNELYWYSTAGFVQVKTAEEFEYDLIHNERGLTKDVYLDTSRPAVGTFYMSADFHGWSTALCVAACWNWDPGYLPDWTVEATVLHASLGPLHTNASERPDVSDLLPYGTKGTVIAHGISDPQTMASFDSTVPVVGAHTVYEFMVPLAWDEAFVASGGVVPPTDNIIIHWEWYEKTANPAGGMNEYIYGSGAAGIVWNLNTGEDYPANVVLPVRNPIDVELVYPQFIHDKLVILSVINTPWGSYDIDPSLITVTVKDAQGDKLPIQEDTLSQVLEQSVAHTGHYNPIKPTWVWDYQKQGVEPGDYTVTVSVTNFQHSVTSETTAKFSVGADGTGGATEAARSGIQTLQGNLHAGHEGTAADPNAATSTSSAPPATTTEKSPGLSVPVALAVVAAVLLARRRHA